jgi:hypothetical protein
MRTFLTLCALTLPAAAQTPQIVQTAINPANGRTYHLLEPADWTVSEAAAVALGGHLATVDDQAENDWLVATFKNQGGTDIDLWIGFNDMQVEGQFVWSSGAPITYTNWDIGEPSNAGGNEDFATIRKNNPLGMWNDLPDHPVGFHADSQGVVEIGSGVIFCTAKTALVCGAPAIQDSGASSASAASGFTLSAGPARSCRSGILLYNTAQLGAGIPFQGGTLCVEAMGLRRAGPMNSMGTPGNAFCDGRFALDMNAFAQNLWVVPDCAGAPAGLPPNVAAGYLATPGQAVFTQIWGRDSVATGSFLSNGVQYVVGP